MNFFHFAYNLIGSSAAIVLIPPLWMYYRLKGDNQEQLYQRLGIYPEPLRRAFSGSPRIWLHAVSVGEVGVAAAIIKALKLKLPYCQVVLSTTTKQGLAQAHAYFDKQTVCFFSPLDLQGPARKALQMVKPDILALLETEIWPNLIVNASRMGIRTAVLNGRISLRTVHRYSRIKPLISHTLAHVDIFSMISAGDAQRIRSLGAPQSRITIQGNAKFDVLDPSLRKEEQHWAQMLLNLDDSTPVFVAGSTREPEEQTILDAYLQIQKAEPRAVLIIAPRHTDRSGQIEQWVKAKGLHCVLRSHLDGSCRPPTTQVVILDTIGELSTIYSIANFVFCGGSLVPKGGQNLLEPAMRAKPVMYGPSMEDFADARQLIEKVGGGTTVYNADQIARTAIEWLVHPEHARAKGFAARQAILPHRGAAQKHADVLVQLLRR